MSSIDNKINEEYSRLVQMDKIQRELMTLEKSLNNCIDITSSSVENPKLNQYYDDLRIDNTNSFRKTNEELSENINNTKRTVISLINEKEKEEDKEKEEKKEEK